MSSFHFPIILGKDKSERVVIIHLGDKKEKGFYEENRVVITSKGSKKTPLFRIPTDVNVISQDGEEPDKSFVFEAQDLKKNDKQHTYNEVVITIKGKQKLKMEKKDDYYNYYLTEDGGFDGIVLFDVLNDKNDCSLSGSLHIVRPGSHDRILKINVDLGSDATQLNYFTEQSGTDISNVRIVECFKKAYKNRKYDELQDPQNGDPLFIQEEKDNSSFYKTGNITFQNDGNIRKAITSDTSFINYLNISSAGKNEPGNVGKKETWVLENNYNRKLINIKLMYAYCKELENDVPDLNYYYQKEFRNVKNQKHLKDVLFNIYQQIIKTSIVGEKLDKDYKYCSVLVLVPNIYNQQNIDGLLYELNKMNKQTRTMKYDFRVISESDSAFVGIKEIKNRGAQKTILDNMLQKIKKPRQKDMFLIIDAGKGTTDYSIIKYFTGEDRRANNEMVSVERDGIAGAGGSIDYVFTRVFARQIYNHITDIYAQINLKNGSGNNLNTNAAVNALMVNIDDFTNRFMIMIEQLSPLDQDKMMQLVEVLKKNYDDKKSTTAKLYDCFADNDAIGIIETLGGKNIGSTDYNAIKNEQAGWKHVSRWNWDETSFVDVNETDRNEINRVCDTIAKNIIDQKIFAPDKDITITNQIDYVIFNGRAFKFEPLKKAFERRIEKYKGVRRENHGFFYFLLENNDDNKNLKIANLDGYNMKSVSVLFKNHDLGVNCNSDLCCMDRLDYAHEAFNQRLFWEGFDQKISDTETKKHYYIGYTGEYSFVPSLDQTGSGINNSDLSSLLSMTLYPIKYRSIDFNKMDDEGSGEELSGITSDSTETSISDVVDDAISDNAYNGD